MFTVYQTKYLKTRPQHHLGVILSCIIIFNLTSFSSAQTCSKTRWQRNRNHACPFFTREAFTAEKRSPTTGFMNYMKICCDHETLTKHHKEAAKACKTTRCVLPSEPSIAYSNPCSTLANFIVDGQYIISKENLRDNCVQEVTGHKGVAAVCCPPNSMANVLVSTYGAERNEFPHQAKLQSEDELCGGTVYNKDYIITAAHCVTGKDGLVKDPQESFVVLGTNIAALDSATNIFPVKRIVVHESFSLRKGHPEFERFVWPPKRIFNDVAVVQLAKSIDFKAQPTIKALPLAPPNFKPGLHADEVVIVGWGTTDNGLITPHLQKANLLIRQNEQCFKTLLGGGPYSFLRDFSDQLLCVGGLLNGKFSPVAGRGDSGGAAICRGADGYAVHCGITSFGGDGDLCSKNVDEPSCRPSAYADVSHFRDWIRKHAGEQQQEGLLREKLYGDPVPLGQYDHQVHVTSFKGPSCGGTLISKDTVVTAGHCVFMDDKQPRAGVTITTRNGNVHKAKSGGILGSPYFSRYDLLEKLNHRKSGKKSYLTPPYIDDIAVVKLASSVSISGDKLPRLPNSSEAFTSTANPAVELSVSLGTKPTGKKSLSQRNFRILDSKDCQRRLDGFKVFGVEAKFDLGKVFCGVEVYSGGGICDRETGGGLICAGNGGKEQVLCGVQTFRLCDMSMPSTFVNVGRFKGMIEKAL